LGHSIAYASDLPDFRDLLRATAANRHLSLALVEKDYFAMRALRRLASSLSGKFVFKGGTSLSKGWGIIHRFSEDLDVLFHRSGISGNEVRRRLKNARELVKEDSIFTWIESEEQSGNKNRTSFFTYQTCSESPGILRPRIQLESGCRGEPQPHESRTVTSFVTEHALALNLRELANDLSPFSVECLHFTRTFVEKLFAIHDLFLRRQIHEKMRHYYDVYCLLGLGEIQDFIGTREYGIYCDEVCDFVHDEFPEACIPDALRFSASPAFEASKMASLKADYQKEVELIFDVAPSFEQIIERIADARNHF
jgi:predicted nucleotidyltransferase component of viral defense system